MGWSRGTASPSGLHRLVGRPGLVVEPCLVGVIAEARARVPARLRRRLGLGRRLGHGVLGRVRRGLGLHRGSLVGGVGVGALGGRGRARELAALRRSERLLLQAGHLFGVGTAPALELEVLFDGVVEQSHLAALNPTPL